MKVNSKVCSRCVMDSSVPGIIFDENGVCNYCTLHTMLEENWPTGEVGMKKFNSMIDEIKRDGTGKRYDSVIGISGGTDSVYLLYLMKKNGLRPLAVHFDNGWNSEIAAENMKKALSALNVDLVTHVMDWEEARDILLAYLKASLPWPDSPADIGITSILYRKAAEIGVKHVIVGNNFRTEGKQPTEWTYGDGRMMRHVQKTFGTKSFKTFPNLTLAGFVYYSIFRRIKIFRPLNYVPYRKEEAQKVISKELGWRYYGGHHHENVYTRFLTAYVLPQKFKIDKRKVTFSALIRSGQMDRGQALAILAKPSLTHDEMERDREYVMKRLGITEDDFTAIMDLPLKSFHDYPSYYSLFRRLKPIVALALRLALSWKPPFLLEIEVRKNSNKHTCKEASF